MSSVSIRGGVARRQPENGVFEEPARLLLRGLIAVVVGAALPWVAMAQAGRLEGRVINPSGDPVPGVGIVALARPDEREIRRAVTGPDGFYSIQEVAPGVYRVGIEAGVALAQPVTDVTILASESRMVNFVLPRPPPSSSERRLAVEIPSGRGVRFDAGSLTDLPLPTNIWFLIGNLEPSSISEPIDTGGVAGPAPGLFASHGSSWTESAYEVNGADVTDPQEPGRTLFYPALPAVSEVTVTTSMQGVDLGGAGARVRIQTLRGDDHWHASLPLFLAGRAMQGTNLDDGQRAQGVPASPKLRSVLDSRGRVGGPIIPGRLYLMTAYDLEAVSRDVPGFRDPVRQTVRGGTLRADHDWGSGAGVSLIWSRERLTNDHDGADFRLRGESTRRWSDHFNLYQLLWHRSPRSDLDERGVVSLAQRTSEGLFQPQSTPEPTHLEAFRGRVWGPAPFQTRSRRRRLGFSMQWTYLPGSLPGPHHLIQAGAGWSQGSTLSRFDVAGDQHLVFDNLETHPYRDGLPLPLWVIRFNTPVIPRTRVWEASMFVSDQVRLAPPLTLGLAVRSSIARGSLPGQGSPGGTFASARTFPARQDLIRWNSLSPRLSVTYRFGAQPTLLRLSLSRYPHRLAGSLLDHGNANSLSSQVYEWNDIDGDGEFQDPELGQLLRVRGGAFSRIDPQLDVPLTREVAIAMDHAFPYVDVSLLLVHRTQRHRVQTVNTGVGFDTYQTVEIVDPGESVLPDDDRILTVYGQDPQTLGQDRFLLTNPEGLTARHRALQLTLARHDPTTWSYFLAASAYESTAPTNPGNSVYENDPGVVGELFSDPNTLIHTDSRLFFDRAYTLRVAGYYMTSWGMRISGLARYYDGRPYARTLVIRGLQQGPFIVMATPKATLAEGGPRTEYNAEVDLRIQQPFSLPNGHRITTVLDLYNLLNANSNTIENDLTGPDFKQRIPLEIQAPRSMRVGFRYEF